MSAMLRFCLSHFIIFYLLKETRWRLAFWHLSISEFFWCWGPCEAPAAAGSLSWLRKPSSTNSSQRSDKRTTGKSGKVQKSSKINEVTAEPANTAETRNDCRNHGKKHGRNDCKNPDQSCKCGKPLWGASFTAKASSTCNRNFSSNTALNVQQGPLKIKKSKWIGWVLNGPWACRISSCISWCISWCRDVSCSELFLIFPNLEVRSLANVSLLRSGWVPLISTSLPGLPGVPCVSGAGSVDALTSGVIFILRGWWVDPFVDPQPIGVAKMSWTKTPGTLAPRLWHWWAGSAAALQSLADPWERMRAEVDESRCTIVERDNNLIIIIVIMKIVLKNKKMTIRIIYT